MKILDCSWIKVVLQSKVGHISTTVIGKIDLQLSEEVRCSCCCSIFSCNCTLQQIMLFWCEGVYVQKNSKNPKKTKSRNLNSSASKGVINGLLIQGSVAVFCLCPLLSVNHQCLYPQTRYWLSVVYLEMTQISNTFTQAALLLCGLRQVLY